MAENNKKLNIFLDTNIIVNDWFFQTKNMKITLYLIKENLVDVYVSSIVMEEFRKKFKSGLEESYLKVKKGIENINEFSFLEKYKVSEFINTENLIEDFNKNVNEYLTNYFHLVMYSKHSNFKEMMDIIINNAIDERPPFEKKDKGFRDSLIFESYLDTIKSKQLSHCFFVTKDKIFKENEIDERINEMQIELTIINNLEEIFAHENISHLLKENESIISQEKNIEQKIINYVNKNEEYICIKFVESFMSDENIKKCGNHHVVSFYNYKIVKMHFDYEYQGILWISVEQEITIRLVEVNSEEIENYDKQNYFDIRVLGYTNLEINGKGIEDFSTLDDDKILINSIEAERKLEKFPKKSERRFEKY